MSSTLQKNMPAIVAGVLCLLVLILATSNFVQAEEASSTAETKTSSAPDRRTQNQIERPAVTAKHASTSEAWASRRERTRSERSDAIKQKQEEIQAARADRKAALQATAQNRITNLAANLSNRMDAAVNRIQNVIDRLTSRINKLDELGVDTTAASESLDKAQQEIDHAKTILSTVDTKVAEFTGSEDPRASWENLKAIYSEARDAIKAAHEALKETITSLKEAVRAADISRGVSSAVSNSDHSSTTTP